MAAPSPLPHFATDTDYTAPGQEWDGVPTKVAIPSGEMDTGWAPRYKPPAEKLNWLLNLICQWISYLNTSLQPVLVTKQLDLQGATSGYNAGETAWTYGPNGGGAICWTSTDAGGSSLYIPIDLPPGSTIAALTVRLKNNNSGSVQEVFLHTIDRDGTAADDSSTNAHADAAANTSSQDVVLIKTTPVTVANTTRYLVRLSSGHANDEVYSAIVSYYDPCGRAA